MFDNLSLDFVINWNLTCANHLRAQFLFLKTKQNKTKQKWLDEMIERFPVMLWVMKNNPES